MTVATTSYLELLEVSVAYRIPMRDLVEACDGYLSIEDSLIDYEDTAEPLFSGPAPLFDIRRPVHLQDEVVF